MRSTPRVLVLFGGLLAAAAVIASGAANDPPRGEPRPSLETYHRDGPALERLTLDVMRALFRGDTGEARERLDRMAELEVDVTGSGGEDLPPRIRTLRQALTVTINRSREFSGKGRLVDTFQEFVWVQRTCVDCHDASRALQRESGGETDGDVYETRETGTP